MTLEKTDLKRKNPRMPAVMVTLEAASVAATITHVATTMQCSIIQYSTIYHVATIQITSPYITIT